jgi:hypothetical protein
MKCFHIINLYGTVAFLRIRLSVLGPAMTNDIFFGLPRVPYNLSLRQLIKLCRDNLDKDTN